jgi:POT family proton-dependent oligopeptide transporter
MVAGLTASETVAGQVLDPGKALQTYVQVFEMIGLWGLALGAGLILLSPILRYLAHPEKSTARVAQPAE